MAMGAMISHSQQDLAIALQFRDLLSVAGVRVWMDRTDIVFGNDWQRSIESAIKECEVVIVLFSKASLASREVEAEWSLALRLCSIHFPRQRHYSSTIGAISSTRTRPYRANGWPCFGCHVIPI